MTQTIVPSDSDEGVRPAGEPGLIAGRPVEDRTFEALEASVGIAAGAALGTALAGPIGTAVGGLLGAVAGFAAGEAIERAAGPAATTTDCVDAASARGAGAVGDIASPERAVSPEGGGAGRRFITYPTDRLLAVADSPEQADSVAARLRRKGFTASDVAVITRFGPGPGLAGLGSRRGPFAGLIRLVQFTTMDQMPDFRVYEDAVLAGRSVIAVRVDDSSRLRLARDVLEAGGLHFLNFFGRWSTMEIAPWAGTELDEPDYLRR